ncbi:Bacteriohemerythrin [Candidatus Magnetaquicoccaceae bacterium FCR-1]|uniref:Bacteriohemerythrin n=1 Tax=Candidatus Magnetaquiglobus chichijimensis TaxID=3141448 RepID=A0ABQ0C7H9_9PROT
MKITQKIFLGFLTPLIMLLILGTWGIVVSTQVIQATRQASEVGFKLAIEAKQMELSVVQVQQWLTDISATRAAEGFDDGFTKAEENAQAFLKGIETFRQYARQTSDQPLLQRLDTLQERFAAFQTMGKKMAQAYIDGGPPAGNAMMGSFDEQAEGLAEVLRPFLEMEVKNAEEDLQTVQGKLAFLRGGILIILLIALAAVGVIGFWLGRSITQPIHAIVHVMDLVSHGDLTVQPTGDHRKDELGTLNHHFKRLIHIFSENIRQINLQAANITAFVAGILHMRDSIGRGSHDLDVIAREVAGQNHQLIDAIGHIQGNVTRSVENLEALHHASRHVSERINTIASASEEANAGITQMADSARHMLGNIESVHGQLTEVHDAISSVANASDAMKRSLDEVRERCRAALFESETTRERASEAEAVMEELSNSAHEIGAVVEIINRINEQTSMLALNAAIEAAGAGEAGKGFAVVANEVKALARQTSEATLLIQEQIMAIRDQTRAAKEKTDIIHESVERINAANEAIDMSVNAQSEMTDRIVQAVDKVALATGEVNASTEALQTSASDVARAADQAALGSREIADSAEQIALSAQEMYDRTQLTVESAESIQQTAERTNQLAIEVRDKADNSLKVVETMHGIVNHFQAMSDVVSGISEALYTAQARMYIGSEPFNIRRIKEAVIDLMYRLHLAVATRDPTLASQINDPACCDVKRWLRDALQESHLDLPLYQKMEATHAQLRQTAFEILNLIPHEDRQESLSDALIFFHELRRVFFEQLNQLYLGRSDDRYAHPPLILWHKTLSVGVEAFDIDHKNLLELINQLHTAMQENQGVPQIKEILDDLLNYAITHFSREEQVLADHGYPGLDAQHQQHERFLHYITERNNAMDQGDSFALAAEMLKYLKDWLLQHILKHDMAYTSFLTAKGVK